VVNRSGCLTLYDTAGLEFRGVAPVSDPAANLVIMTQWGEMSVDRLATCELTSVTVVE
jgi:hypothetical protein